MTDGMGVECGLVNHPSDVDLVGSPLLRSRHLLVGRRGSSDGECAHCDEHQHPEHGRCGGRTEAIRDDAGPGA
jgi:hypothetical protein